MQLLFVLLKALVALAAVVTVIVVRPDVSWVSLGIMLAALLVLLGLLAAYNRRYQ